MTTLIELSTLTVEQLKALMRSFPDDVRCPVPGDMPKADLVATVFECRRRGNASKMIKRAVTKREKELRNRSRRLSPPPMSRPTLSRGGDFGLFTPDQPSRRTSPPPMSRPTLSRGGNFELTHADRRNLNDLLASEAEMDMSYFE